MPGVAARPRQPLKSALMRTRGARWRTSMRVIDSRVVNIDEVELEHFSKGNQYECSAFRVGARIGAKELGYSYDVVPPGKRAGPFHSHRGEEEMFFIVRGEGTLRYGSEPPRV